MITEDQVLKPVAELPGPLLLLAGPTGVGKSRVALDLARTFAAEIVNADSLQIYRYLDIGTAKPSLAERRLVPHHLFDILEPDQSFNATDFQQRADVVIADILGRGRLPLLVGGTGLYLRALLYGLCPMPEPDSQIRRRLEVLLEREGSEALHARLQKLDPELAVRLAPRDKTRVLRGLETILATGHSLLEFQRRHGFREPRYNFLLVYLDKERRHLYDRINQRVEEMLAAGLEDEVRALLARGFAPKLKPLQSIGYRQMIDFLAGRIDLAAATADIKQASRRYAKRQLTWLRHDSDARGFTVDQLPELTAAVRRFLAVSKYGITSA